MTLFNERIKDICLKEILLLIFFLYFVKLVVSLFAISLSESWISLGIILFFIYRLRNYYSEFKLDITGIFSGVSFKKVLYIVLLNVFFSYGMLYLTNYLMVSFPFLTTLNSSLMSVIAYVGSFLSVIVISPVVEELLFRGVVFNKLNLIIPVKFSIFASSLLFAALHPVGVIFSAAVFGICMAILYIKSGNIILPVFAHFLNNLIAESIVFLDKEDLMFSNDLVVSVISVLSVVSFILILKFFADELNSIK